MMNQYLSGSVLYMTNSALHMSKFQSNITLHSESDYLDIAQAFSDILCAASRKCLVSKGYSVALEYTKHYFVVDRQSQVEEFKCWNCLFHILCCHECCSYYVTRNQPHQKNPASATL